MAITVDGSTIFQGIDGFGAAIVQAYQGGYSPSVANFLFSPSNGIGLSILRSELWVDTTTGEGWPTYETTADSTGVVTEGDFSIELQAFDLGVRNFMVTCWTPQQVSPYSWLSGGSPNGSLLTSHYADMANAFTTYWSNLVAAGVVKANKWTSPMNEPDFSPGYPQTSWTETQALSFLDNNLGPALALWATNNPSEPAPNIVWGETSQWSNLATWVSAAEGDSTAKALINRYATHQYDTGGVASAPTGSHPVWETEVLTPESGSQDPTMSSALTMWTYIYNALTTGNASAWFYWYTEDVSDPNCSGLIGTDGSNYSNPTLSLQDWNRGYLASVGNFNKRAYAMGNASKFVRPGWWRINATGAPSGVNVLAFAGPGGQFAIICINTNSSTQAVTINLSHVGAALVETWVTDPNNNLASQGFMTSTGGSLSFTLTATSVTTFVSVAANCNYHGAD